jgi:hypothetical protein
MFSDKLLLLMYWRAHRKPQILSLLGSGNNTSIIVGKNNQGMADEGGIENSLATAKEVIAVNNGNATAHQVL